MPGKAPSDAGNPGDLSGMGGFDFSALHNVLNDPSIKSMAEQIARDPAFAQMSAALTATMGGGGAEANLAGGRGAMPVDPEQYASAMTNVLQNPQFMDMAEKLGQQLIQQDPSMASLVSSMHNPNYRENITSKVEELKKDPEVAPILEELERDGPAAMMKYWHDPLVLEKLGKVMSPDGPDGSDRTLAVNEDGEEAEPHEGEEEEITTVLGAASNGEHELLQQLLKDGADKDEQDDEGRTALHFAVGYGELECAEILLNKGASVDLVDHNKNTALHYAAGYGQADAVRLLLKHGVDVNAKNLEKVTALELAKMNDQQEVVDLFKTALKEGGPNEQQDAVDPPSKNA